MHQDFDIELENISKIEGHTDMALKVRDGKAIECKLKIDENKRFFQNAILNKNFNQVPQVMARICGTCSTAHLFGSIEAIEKALDLKPTKQTIILRNLLMNAGHLRDHAMHLYFFCLPDVFKVDSILDFPEDKKELIHEGLHVKEAGNYLATIIGGRAVHPPYALIGGFTKIPSKEEIREAKKKLKSVRESVIKIIDIFYNDKTSFKRKANYVAIVNKDYNFLEGQIKTAKGTTIPEKDFRKHLEEVVLPYSSASAFTWESKDYMVGALARLNLNKENLHKDTLRDIGKYLDIFPNDCVFNNNTAQAIECLHIIDSSLDLLENDFKKEEIIKPKIKKSIGTGVVEAPRGTLYYQIELNEKGNVINIELCIPTQQNIIHLEKDITRYVEFLLKNKEMTKEKISLEIEKMIRAYDPCMSCATHFLRINWI